MASTDTVHSKNTCLVVEPEEDDDSLNDQVALEIPNSIKIYKNRRLVRYTKWTWVPPSLDPDRPVLSKDVLINSETGLTARLFIPTATETKKESSLLPLLIYFHGGGFVIESACSSIFHSFINTLVAESKVVALSVDYRLAPENPITACYEDSWNAIQWALSHSKGDGPESWLNQYVDFNRVFFGGDSAGGNIAVNMAWRAGTTTTGLAAGMVLIHPFMGNDYEKNVIFEFYCPDCKGIFDPRLNPKAHPELLAALGCKRALVCVAEKDEMDVIERKAVKFYEALKESDWKGEAEMFESLGEGHDFQLFKPDTDKARELRSKIAQFLNQLP